MATSKVRKAVNWFKSHAKKLISGKSKKEETTPIPQIGQTISFVYDAKHKDTLPTWDRFPIVIPFEVNNKSFKGLNLHYLSLKDRMALLKALDKTRKIKNNRDRFIVNWGIIKQVAESKHYNATVKMYLYSHVKTKFNVISLQEDYSNIIHLPAAKWVGKKPY